MWLSTAAHETSPHIIMTHFGLLISSWRRQGGLALWVWHYEFDHHDFRTSRHCSPLSTATRRIGITSQIQNYNIAHRLTVTRRIGITSQIWNFNFAHRSWMATRRRIRIMSLALGFWNITTLLTMTTRRIGITSQIRDYNIAHRSLFDKKDSITSRIRNHNWAPGPPS